MVVADSHCDGKLMSWPPRYLKEVGRIFLEDGVVGGPRSRLFLHAGIDVRMDGKKQGKGISVLDVSCVPVAY